MSSLSSTVSEYQFTPVQTQALSAPIVGQYFAEQDQVFSRDNASTKAHFGSSSIDQQSYDAANYQMFNPTLELGVDCGRVNEAAARPDVGNSGCYPASISAQKAATQMDANYNAFAPSAATVVLAEGDLRYAPARFADQNNYISPSMSDYTYQPRLMGTRDTVSGGCFSTQLDGTIGNSTTCALRDDPLPFYKSSDPRTAYGVDEPHSPYWANLEESNLVRSGCHAMSDNFQTHASMCNLNSVLPGFPQVRMPANYGNPAQWGAAEHNYGPLRAF